LLTSVNELLPHDSCSYAGEGTTPRHHSQSTHLLGRNGSAGTSQHDASVQGGSSSSFGRAGHSGVWQATPGASGNLRQQPRQLVGELEVCSRRGSLGIRCVHRPGMSSLAIAALLSPCQMVLSTASANPETQCIRLSPPHIHLVVTTAHPPAPSTVGAAPNLRTP
jgi:hypothetical protein